MIIKTAEFIKSAVKPEHYPESDLPEIAFAGRSNVGKSSLINALLNRKRLVKTSSTPGRTQLLNFFDINENFFFVDLPGYGYAKVPIYVRKSWGEMVENYLNLRKNLTCVVLIIDIRRDPGIEDFNFIDWLNFYSINYIIVFTKADKLSRGKQLERRKKISEKFDINKEAIILFSAKSKLGKDKVWEAIIGRGVK
ncbi:MAG: YihA family ribosome biogenesis GTP-binding protein [Deltaproteobacteria bacterium]|nr:YihA family ribosome biogenesis GTP-binding protein [Deltaproteobacteria bacterium]